MQIKNRIKELIYVKAKDLIPNPKNWRTHPDRQKDALKGVLAEIGYADALLARKTDDGKYMLIDGHLRAETTPDQDVPVLVVDLDEKEADKLLALLDPLSAMAGTDEELLRELTANLETQNEAVRNLVDSMLENNAEPLDDLENELKTPDEVAVPELFQILIVCDGEEEQKELFERFQQEGLNCKLLNL